MDWSHCVNHGLKLGGRRSRCKGWIGRKRPGPVFVSGCDEVEKFHMLDVVETKSSQRAAARAFDVEILSVATANPSFQTTQAEATKRACKIYPHLEPLWPLYDNTGIEVRYNCEPIDWYF